MWVGPESSDEVLARSSQGTLTRGRGRETMGAETGGMQPQANGPLEALEPREGRWDRLCRLKESTQRLDFRLVASRTMGE